MILNFKPYERTKKSELENFYKNPFSAFKKGNYVYSAFNSEHDAELKGKSLVLLGLIKQGLNIIENCQISNHETLLIISFAYWMLDDNSNALYFLNKYCKKVEITDSLKKYSTVLKGKKINALVMDKESKFLNREFDDVFNIKKIGYYEEDIAIKIDSKAGDLILELNKINFKPDFLFVFRPELIPIFSDFDKLPFKKICFSTDYDLHIYQKYHDFLKFDKIIVYSAMEHFEMQYVFPNVDIVTHAIAHTIIGGNKDESIYENKEEKIYDLMITGNTYTPFFKEKSKFITQLLMLNNNLNLYLNDGFLNFREYFEIIKQSKFVPSYVRFNGTFSTRNIDTLSKGGIPLFIHDDIIEFILPENSMYLKCNDFCYFNKMVNILKNKIHFNHNMDEINDTTKILSSYKKLLKFNYIQSNFFKTIKQESEYKNNVKLVGYYEKHGTAQNDPIQEKIIEVHEKCVEFNAKNKELNSIINLGLSYLYYYQYVKSYKPLNYELLLDKLWNNLLNVHTEGIRLYPDSIVLRFNIARILFNYGYLEEANPFFYEIITNNYILNPFSDDIGSALYFEENNFLYRDYIDTLILIKKGNKNVNDAISILKSGCCYYLALINESYGKEEKTFEYLKKSIELFPENFLAKAMIVKYIKSQYIVNPRKEYLEILLKYYKESSEESPLYLHHNLFYALFALKKLGWEKDINELMLQWYLFFKRYRKDEKLLFLNFEMFEQLLEYKEYFCEEALNIFEKIEKFLKTNEKDDFTNIEDLIIVSLYLYSQKIDVFSKLVEDKVYIIKNTQLYYTIGNIMKGKNNKIAAKNFIVFLEKCKNISINKLVEIYNFASFLKREKLFDYSKQIFLYLFERQHHKWGTCFHLGEIFFNLNQENEAIKWFEKCLIFNPDHKKSKDYLIKLNNS